MKKLLLVLVLILSTFLSTLNAVDNIKINLNDTLKSTFVDTIEMFHNNREAINSQNRYNDSFTVDINKDPGMHITVSINEKTNHLFNYSIIRYAFHNVDYNTNFVTFIVRLNGDIEIYPESTAMNIINDKNISNFEEVLLKGILKYREELKSLIHNVNTSKENDVKRLIKNIGK
jgi:hypothetical protein